MFLPSSSNSLFVIHICSNLSIFERIAPPSQLLCFLSAGENTAGPIGEGASAWTSFSILFWIPSNIVQPPARTIFWNKFFLISPSHFIIELNVNWWMPSSTAGFYYSDGLKSSSGHLRHSSLTEIQAPVGNLYSRDSWWVGSVACFNSAS